MWIREIKKEECSQRAGKPLRDRDLKGKRIGFRTDHIWTAYDVFAGRLQELVRERYQTSDFEHFENTQNTGGRAIGHESSPEFMAFADKVDVAILGLCA
ncbi:MAG: hypothetical protein HYX92_06185 [Chloroflexi bacterium]|nr:hypothetical protein [Chloroflexota bacterium]